jgi:hypothetical protein
VFKMFDNSLDKIQSVGVKYHDLSKRKLMWNLWEKDREKYASYAEFKAEFNPKSSILKTILSETKADLSNEIKSLIKSDNPFGRERLEVRNINKIGTTQTQEELNRINSKRYKPHSIEDSQIKRSKIRK